LIAVEVKNLIKNFGGLRAVNNVSLSVGTGERRAIIGPNGAGKTTLLNLIGGRYPCDRGQILLFDRDITQLPDYRRTEFGVARTFQLTSVFLDLSVLDNILLSIQAVKPYRFGMLKPQRGYADLLDKAAMFLNKWDLWEERNRLIRELSYGEQRKVELIMGFASDPKILLLDEPTSGLSAAESAYLADLIVDAGKDITLLIVEHDMDVVFSIATKITVLHYGSVLVEGTPQEISDHSMVREVYLGLKDPSGNIKD
jgi:branched-chain amino acid transport system ATP-binding protein